MPKQRDAKENAHLKGKPKDFVNIYLKIDEYCADLRLNVGKKMLSGSTTFFVDIPTQPFCVVKIGKRSVSISIKMVYKFLPEFVKDMPSVKESKKYPDSETEIRFTDIEDWLDLRLLVRQSCRRVAEGRT